MEFVVFNSINFSVLTIIPLLHYSLMCHVVTPFSLFLPLFSLSSFDPALPCLPVLSCTEQVGQSQHYYPPCKRAAQQAGSSSPSLLHVSSREKRLFLLKQHHFSKQNKPSSPNRHLNFSEFQRVSCC